MLSKAKVDRVKCHAVVRHAIDDKPAGQCVAAATITRPAQSALHRIVEREALQTTVITGFELTQGAHGLEVTEPSLVPVDGDRETSVRHARRQSIRRSVKVGAALPYVVTRVAFEVDIVTVAGVAPALGSHKLAGGGTTGPGGPVVSLASQ